MSALGISGVMRRIEELQDRIGKIIAQAAPSDASPDSSSFSKELAGADARLEDSPDSLKPLITETAKRHSLSPRLLEAVAGAESAFNPAAVSSKGAQGLMQLMPGTQQMMGVSDPFDPAQSLEGGARYLKENLTRFGGDVRKALAAYNAGPGAVEKHNGIPPYAETQSYVTRIMNSLSNLPEEGDE